MWSIPLDGGIRGFREVKIGCWGEPALVPTSKSHTEKKEEKHDTVESRFKKAWFKKESRFKKDFDHAQNLS